MSWTPRVTDFFVELPGEKGKRVPYAARRIRHERNEAGTTVRHDLMWIKTPSLSDPHFVKMWIGLGRPPYKLVNDLVRPPGIPTERYITPMRIYNSNADTWERYDDFDVENDAGFYVMLNCGLPEHIKSVKLCDLIGFLESKRAIHNARHIIGIPKSRKSVLSKSDQWIDMVPVLKAAYRKALNVKQAAVSFSVKEITIDKGDQGTLERLNRKLGRFDPASPFVQAIKAYDRLGAIEATAAEFKSAWNHRWVLDYEERAKLDEEYNALAKSDPALVSEIGSIKSAIEGVFQAYPLLQKVPYPDQDALKALDDYIVAMDCFRGALASGLQK
jgi:hypothetical protein